MRTSEYDSTLHYLFGLRTFGIHLGLETPAKLAAYFGDPQKKFPAVHIAGTNGKGTTAALVEAVLRARGYKTGLYTSPHLVEMNERIRVNGHPIEDESIVDYAGALKPLAEETGAAFFEVTTAIALNYFAEMGIDVAVVEVGLGARLDATMLVEPVCTAVTSVGLDHTEYLGDTVEAIAREKAHIMRKGVPCVTGRMKPEAMKVLTQFGEDVGAELISAESMSPVEETKFEEGGVELTVGWKGSILRELSVPLLGVHQLWNVRTALGILGNLGGFEIDEGSVRAGFGSVEWKGRMEALSRKPLVLYDVAHNGDAVESLFTSLETHFPGRRITGLAAIMKGKDAGRIVRIAGDRAERLFFTEIPGHESHSAEELVSYVPDGGANVKAVPDFHEAVNEAVGNTDDDGLLIIFGTHYIAEEVYKRFDG